VSTSYQLLTEQLLLKLDQARVITDPALCFSLATDASLYRLTPKIIVKVDSIKELVLVMKLCVQHNAAYTFRAAGTSLSGQAVSESVLIMLTENWKRFKILDKGDKIQLQPGIIGADANRYLAPYHKKIGPDPASIDSCKIGGIAANNASGMCCGTTENSYQTLSSMTVVLADGCVLNTADILSIESFRNSHATLLSQLSALALKTKNDRQLKQLIEHKYRLKNTMGFSINALIDFHDPIDILQHLMIGSEGCLGFIADITYKTVINSQYKATALLVYADIETACRGIADLEHLNVAAAELIDGRALQSIKGIKGVPEFIDNLDHEATALLLECHATSEEELAQLTSQVNTKLACYELLEAINFSSDLELCAKLWKVRKGLFPAVGAIRKTGSSVIIEDITFPVSQLAEGTRALRLLFNKHGYDDAIIFGHALVGNLHFVICPDFSRQQEVEQYRLFMLDLSELVAVEYQGSLKSEHGTGRNMAPFVELEWGKTAYQLMQQIKVLFDPDALMNPGVVLNVDRQVHLKDLKILPSAHPLIDKCMECGFCESVCPSRNLSLTPRQRIVTFRQLQQLANQKQTAAIKSEIKLLTKQFNYLGIETCAATGLCAEQCPVGINTGDLMRLLRETNNPLKKQIAKWTANHFGLTTNIVRRLFRLNYWLQKLLPAKIVNAMGGGVARLASYPTAINNVVSASNIATKKIIYMPSCASRNLGTQVKAKDQRSLSDVTLSLLEKAGYQVIIPELSQQLCCGMPYHSQGMADIAKQKSQQLEATLWQSSDQGKYPILIDTSPCKKFAYESFTHSMAIFEPSEFATEFLLDELEIKQIDESIMLHVTCSSRRMNLTQEMIGLAKLCVKNVIVTDDIQCCGWAGNKGFTTPELNQAALSSLKQQIPADCSRGFSNSITCEIGLSHHSGIAFQSILYLLDEVSTSKNS